MADNLLASLYEDEKVSSTVEEEDKSNAFLDFFRDDEVKEEEVVEARPVETKVDEDDLLGSLYTTEESPTKDTRTAFEQVEQAEAGTKSLDEFADDEEFVKNVNEYGKARFGKDGIQQEDESN